MTSIVPEIFINVVANVVANFLVWLFLGLITLFLLTRNSRIHFLKFFGLTKRKKVKIYFSNLWDPNKAKNNKPWGSILSGREFEASQILSRLFGSTPFSIPEKVRGFVDAFLIGQKCEVILEVSPMDDNFDKNNNLIVIGSSLKNRVRRVLSQKGCVRVIIDGEPLFTNDIDIHTNTLLNRFLVLLGSRKDNKLEKSDEFELGIIEKIHEEKRVIFFCLGKTGYGTRATTEYLARNWQELWQTHQDKSFARCLWFPKQDLRNESVVDWQPIYYEDVHSEIEC
jgi:hypothetical protein